MLLFGFERTLFPGNRLIIFWSADIALVIVNSSFGSTQQPAIQRELGIVKFMAKAGLFG